MKEPDKCANVEATTRPRELDHPIRTATVLSVYRTGAPGPGAFRGGGAFGGTFTDETADGTFEATKEA
jgi:hypothetical protein